MKKILFIALVFAGLNARAQYFNHTYGTGGDDMLTDGIPVAISGYDGYFMVGVTDPGDNPRQLLTSRTDADGNIGLSSGTFKTKHTIKDANGSPQDVNFAKCFEWPTGSLDYLGRYVVVAGYQDNNSAPTKSGIVYLEVNSAGTISYAPLQLHVNAMADYNLSLGGISYANEASGEYVYITGGATLRSNSTVQTVFVIKFNMGTHTIAWFKQYNITKPLTAYNGEFGMDILHHPSTTDLILVAGNIQNDRQAPTADESDVFLLPIDLNGSLYPGMSTQIIGYNSGNSERVQGMNLSMQSPDGFITSGYIHSNSTGTADMWAMKIDGSLNIVWSTAREYTGLAPAKSELGWDILERDAGKGSWEYYQIGHQYGPFDEAIVYKLDGSGNNFGGTDQFTYVNPGYDQGFVITNAVSSPDLALYGNYTNSSGNQDMNLRKVRYDGNTSCEFRGETLPAKYDGPGKVSVDVSVTSGSTTTSFDSESFGADDNEICYSDFLAPVVLTDIKDNTLSSTKHVVLYPNPADKNHAITTISINAQSPGPVSVTLHDMAGRLLYTHQFRVNAGDNAVEIDLSSLHLSAGLFNLKVTGAEYNESRMLMLK